MKTKTCANPNCSGSNPQPLNNFGQCRRSKDGLSWLCKVCLRQQYRKWAKTEKGRKSIRKAKAKYRKTEKNRIAQNHYLQTEKGKETHRKASERYRAKYKAKCRARKAVNYAVEKGQILPVKTQMCVECGKPAQEYHHHKGYDQEHWFDVIPLCAMCHRALD